MRPASHQYFILYYYDFLSTHVKKKEKGQAVGAFVPRVGRDMEKEML